MIFVSIRMPNVQQNVGSLRNPQSAAIGRFDPGIGRCPARQKIERRSQSQRFVQHMIEIRGVRVETLGRIVLDVLNFLKDLVLCPQVSS